MNEGIVRTMLQNQSIYLTGWGKQKSQANLSSLFFSMNDIFAFARLINKIQTIFHYPYSLFRRSTVTSDGSAKPMRNAKRSRQKDQKYLFTLMLGAFTVCQTPAVLCSEMETKQDFSSLDN